MLNKKTIAWSTGQDLVNEPIRLQCICIVQYGTILTLSRLKKVKDYYNFQINIHMKNPNSYNKKLIDKMEFLTNVDPLKNNDSVF